MGVAILAMVADHIYPSIEEATKQIIEIMDITQPNPLWVEAYQKGYALYKEAYISLKEFYKKLLKYRRTKK